MGQRKISVVSREEYELLIPGYPKGSDITLLNTAYIRKRKNEETGKIEPDYLYITYRDNTTGKKWYHKIEEPLYTFYKLKDNYELDHNLLFIEKDKVEPITCKYSDLERAIAEETGNMEFFYDNVTNGHRDNNWKLHAIPDIFMSDVNIEDYYRFLFGRSYTNNIFKLSKGFLDIETDGRYALGDFPEPGEVPINAVSFLDEANNISYQFLLEDPRNPLIEKYKNSFKDPSQMDKLKSFIQNAVGGYKKAVKYGIDKLEYKILFFDDELAMLKTLFDIIEASSPDMMLIWNMAFDLSYIMARLEKLGVDPRDVICSKKFKDSFLRFYIDERNKNEYEERGDFVTISSFTIWLDDMIQFASRRKGRGTYPSFRLDAIGEDVAGVKKLDYSHITSDINMLPYLNYEIFSFYNIMDTIVQKCIECVAQDCEYVFMKCNINNTRYSKCHRQSVYLRNRFTKDFYDYGYIIGNNNNSHNEKPNTKFVGAFVHNSLHNSPFSMMWINGRPTLLCNNMIDFDYSSLYPSIILENNIAPNTQIGRIEIKDKIHDQEHRYMYESDDISDSRYNRAGEFLENYMSGNVLEFCKRWMHLGDIYDVINDIEEYHNQYQYYGKPLNWNDKELIYFNNGSMQNGIQFKQYSGPEQCIIFTDKLDPEKMKRLREEVKKGAIL